MALNLCLFRATEPYYPTLLLGPVSNQAPTNKGKDTWRTKVPFVEPLAIDLLTRRWPPGDRFQGWTNAAAYSDYLIVLKKTVP